MISNFETHDYLSNIDPRLRMLYGIVCMMSIILIKDVYGGIIIASFVILIYVSWYNVHQLVNTFWGLKWYFILFFFFYFILSGTINIDQLVLLILKFVILLVAFTGISKSLNPDEITDALLKMGIPSNLAWSVGVSLRQFYFILEEVRTLWNLYSRDLNSRYSKLTLFTNLQPLMASVFAISIQRASRLKLSLEARGFQQPNKDIITYSTSLDRHDLGFTLLFILPLCALLYVSSQVFM